MKQTWGYHLLLDCTAGDKSRISSRYNIDAFIKELVVRIDMVAFGAPWIESFATHDPADTFHRAWQHCVLLPLSAQLHAGRLVERPLANSSSQGSHEETVTLPSRIASCNLPDGNILCLWVWSLGGWCCIHRNHLRMVRYGSMVPRRSRKE